MKLAILGGSFNPVHLGHLFLAETVLNAFGYDRVLLIPAFQSPFKPGAEAPAPQDRVDMLQASIAGDPRLSVEDCEIRREGVSYTIDTVAQVRERYGLTEKPALILGDDLARSFHQWRRAEDLARETEIIIARRMSTEPVEFPFPCRQLSNEIMNISSAMIRERISRGETWRYLVPAGARYLIEDRRLYGFRPPGTAPGAEVPAAEAPGPAMELPFGALPLGRETIAGLEQAARRMLSPSRFAHSRNTALLAADLCRRYGLDGEAGYLAGIGHDICKSFPPEEMRRLALAGGGKISDLEKKKPSLLHGRAGAVLLRERFGIHNGDILEAVRVHTTGTVDMGPLARVLYIADKLEISREGVASALRELGRTADLDTLFQAVLENTVSWLRSRKLDISGDTRRLLQAGKKGRSREK